MTTWTPQNNEVIARAQVQGVKVIEYREADDGAKVCALTHDGIQIQILQASTLELAAPFVSLEQELIEFAYDYD